MASCSSFLSEQQVLCSICLDVLTEPVSTPCGHNFCQVCITNYWATADLCKCPLCNKVFRRRPKLCVNTAFRDVVENVKKWKVRDEEESAKPGDVPCDVCTGRKLKALKSCLECQTSFCVTHLEPHLRAAALKKHTLIHPVENLEDRMCKKHNRLLEFFCRQDQACICVICMETDHTAHNAFSLEDAWKRKAELGKMIADIGQMMETRSFKVQQVKISLKTSKSDTEREISDSVEVFTALVSSIQTGQAALIQVIEEKQKAAEKQAECFIKDLIQEFTELKRRRSELEKLSQSEDDLHFLQTYSSLSTPPHTKDWPQISVHSGLAVGTVRRAVSQLEDTLMKDISKLCETMKDTKTCEAELKWIQQYAVDVTLEPDTAHPGLILSDDGKQVRHGDTEKNIPDNLERFDKNAIVLGKQSFSSRSFYYEVQVEGKTGWQLGVARESINRKGRITANPGNGYWIIVLCNGDEYIAAADPPVLLSLTEKPQKVGVFVDYEEGQVSFYNVEARSHIYSYTGCNLTEKLYPLFCPGLNDGGKNSAPLIITPVTHTA